MRALRLIAIVLLVELVSSSTAHADNDVAGLIHELATFKRGIQESRPEVLALIRIGSPAVPALIEALRTPGAAPLAAYALGAIQDRSAAPALAACATSGTAELAVHACAVATIALRDPGVLPSVRSFLKKPTGSPVFVYDGALVIVGGFKDQESVPLVRALARHKSQYVRNAVANALGEIGDDSAAGEVLALVKDRDEIVAGSALVAAGKLKLAEAKPAMLAAFNGKDPRAGGQALAYLGELGPLYEALKGKSWAQLEGAILGLAACGDDQAFGAVVAFLAQDQVNTSAAQAAAEGFGRVGDKRALVPLRTVRDQLRQKKMSNDTIDRIITTLEAAR